MGVELHLAGYGSCSEDDDECLAAMEAHLRREHRTDSALIALVLVGFVVVMALILGGVI